MGGKAKSIKPFPNKKAKEKKTGPKKIKIKRKAKEKKAQKKEKKIRDNCYYIFPHLCFKVAPCSSL